MKKSDVEIILELQNQGYMVVVKDPNGKTFVERYEVFQRCGKETLKRVIISDYGTCIGLQG